VHVQLFSRIFLIFNCDVFCYMPLNIKRGIWFWQYFQLFTISHLVIVTGTGYPNPVPKFITTFQIVIFAPITEETKAMKPIYSWMTMSNCLSEHFMPRPSYDHYNCRWLTHLCRSSVHVVAQLYSYFIAIIPHWSEKWQVSITSCSCQSTQVYIRVEYT